jgi:DNA-binding transcriptional regulator/RsmH inhibitor MraZ
LIPQVLREVAELNGTVVILGQIDHLAIWNRQLFEHRLMTEPFTASDLAILTELGV